MPNRKHRAARSLYVRGWLPIPLNQLASSSFITRLGILGDLLRNIPQKKMTNTLDSIFSDRITDVPHSFIREIRKVALDPSVISFAGGLPNRTLFPVEELRDATEQSAVIAVAQRVMGSVR